MRFVQLVSLVLCTVMVTSQDCAEEDYYYLKENELLKGVTTRINDTLGELLQLLRVSKDVIDVGYVDLNAIAVPNSDQITVSGNAPYDTTFTTSDEPGSLTNLRKMLYFHLTSQPENRQTLTFALAKGDAYLAVSQTTQNGGLFQKGSYFLDSTLHTNDRSKRLRFSIGADGIPAYSRAYGGDVFDVTQEAWYQEGIAINVGEIKVVSPTFWRYDGVAIGVVTKIASGSVLYAEVILDILPNESNSLVYVYDSDSSNVVAKSSGVMTGIETWATSTEPLVVKSATALNGQSTWPARKTITSNDVSYFVAANKYSGQSERSIDGVEYIVVTVGKFEIGKTCRSYLVDKEKITVNLIVETMKDTYDEIKMMQSYLEDALGPLGIVSMNDLHVDSTVYNYTDPTGIFDGSQEPAAMKELRELFWDYWRHQDKASQQYWVCNGKGFTNIEDCSMEPGNLLGVSMHEGELHFDSSFHLNPALRWCCGHSGCPGNYWQRWTMNQETGEPDYSQPAIAQRPYHVQTRWWYGLGLGLAEKEISAVPPYEGENTPEIWHMLISPIYDGTSPSGVVLTFRTLEELNDITAAATETGGGVSYVFEIDREVLLSISPGYEFMRKSDTGNEKFVKVDNHTSEIVRLSYDAVKNNVQEQITSNVMIGDTMYIVSGAPYSGWNENQMENMEWYAVQVGVDTTYVADADNPLAVDDGDDGLSSGILILLIVLGILVACGLLFICYVYYSEKIVGKPVFSLIEETDARTVDTEMVGGGTPAE